MNPLPALLLSSALLSACAPDSNREPEVNLGAERDAILAKESAWSEAWGRGELDQIAPLFAENSVLLAPGMNAIVGRDSIDAANREVFAAERAAGLELSWEATEAFVSESGDMAWDYGKVTARDQDGTETVSAYLVVWTKEDGQWKVAADMFN